MVNRVPVFMLILWGACSDGTGGSIDASIQLDASADASADASVDAGLVSPLGQPCAFGPGSCPDGATCLRYSGFGAREEGFCSFSCDGAQDNATCAADYSRAGTPECFAGQEGNWYCGIRCLQGESCPEGLSCFSGICAGDEGLDLESNYLGVACRVGDICPDGGACVTMSGVGSQENGFCTRTCEAELDCQLGYMFLQQGFAGCAAAAPNGIRSCIVFGCVIGDDSSCPPELTCVDNQGERVCVGQD